ncbi:Ig-like domain-containing protein [Aquabacterium sp. NJ1]|uniref:Ig-like domain-containing protein n=1 Tax=Aquabacterium sp. NJ1 TaxID=1538295 RepID=UPI0009DD3B36|nr:Ig-like domain-containing protein [Aquabacterium sp. NJ1]
MNWKNLVLWAATTALVAACGGGGSSSSPAYNVSNNAAFGNGSSGGSSGSTTGSSDVSSNVSGTVVLSLTNSTISASQPATVIAVVKDAAGLPIAGALVQFALTGSSASTLATLSPASAITDANGQAATTLTPAVGATSGATYVSATADTSSGSLTAKKAFSISATNVTLSSVVLSPSSISGYNTALINITVAGASSTSPVTVNVSSTCASGGKASISPSSLTMTGTSGSVTYQDKGCGSVSGGASATDRINVQIVGTTEQRSADLTVGAPSTQGIQFVSVDNPTICQKGTGCPSVANVVFKTVDQTGAAQQGVQVDFSLDNTAATLGSTFGVTAADGTVSVAVAAKNTPSPVRVIAKVHGTTLQTVSNQLTVSGGLPMAGLSDSHTGISFAAEKYALDYSYDGDSADLTLRLTDRYGAPATDGTVVNLVSDGGTVVPAYCVTKDGAGACAVKLVVSNPRPVNGRVHVVAYANGQEYFVDANGNGVHDSNEAYDDTPAAVCLDKDENGACSSTEFLVGDINAPDVGNGVWDDGGSAFARMQRTFFFSSTTTSPRLYQVNGSGACTNTLVNDAYMSITMGGQSSASLQFCVRDGNANADAYGGNPLPSGVAITSAANMANASVNIVDASIPSGVNGPTLHTLTVQNTSTASPQPALASGLATITFMMPHTGSITITQKVHISP